ncbi:GerMN domain-containing protein [Eisenbergiella sp.]
MKDTSNKKMALAAVMLLFFCMLLPACSVVPENQEGMAFDVYYLNREETKIAKEIHYIDSQDQSGQIGELLEAMKAVPSDISLKASVGNSFQVTGFKVEEGGQLDLDVDESYKKLPPTTEVLVRAALVRTLSQAEGINHVLMTVGGQPLADNTGAAIGPMTADAFIDNAGKEINSYEMVKLKLFFANETGDGLVEIVKPVEYNSNISMEKLVVEYLVKGPDIDGVYPVINPGTKILSVTVKDGICYVNFDENFMTQLYNVTADVVVYSIANSLVELPNVNKVQIAVNGKTDIIYRETFNLSNLYERNLDLVKTGENVE